MSLLFILILGIPVYFLSKLILAKLNIGSLDNRKYIALAPTLVLAPLLYIGFILIWIASSSYYLTESFNVERWHTHSENRYKMSEAIIDQDLLIGKHRTEISELLGSDFYTYNDNHIGYTLGFAPGIFNIDPDVLNIYFENDIVVRVTQHKG